MSSSKPSIEDGVSVHIDGPHQVAGGSTIQYDVHVRNGSMYSLNRAQVVVNLPNDANFSGNGGQHAHCAWE